MIRAGFAYEQPDTMGDAVRLLAAAGGRGSVLGGGSVLVPAMTAGEENPALVLDLSRLGLRAIRECDGGVAIGAGTTYAELEASRLVSDKVPLLATMVREVTGGPGLWNLATLGGSACRANPASDGPGCLVALGAEFRLVSVRGSRDMPAARFYRGAFETERAADEILTQILVPVPPEPQRTAYLKLKHAASSWPIVTASCLADSKSVRLCLGGAAPVPRALQWPVDGPLAPTHLTAMAQDAAAAIETEWADELAGPGYRRAVAGTMAARAIHAVTGFTV